MAVVARGKWNDTGISLVAGQEYSFTAAGQWCDWNKLCGPDGYSSDNPILRTTEWLRRVPHEKWFALIGSVDHDRRTFFRIGVKQTRKMEFGGVLTCFANDVGLMYFNNSGAVQLTVTRTA